MSPGERYTMTSAQMLSEWRPAGLRATFFAFLDRRFELKTESSIPGSVQEEHLNTLASHLTRVLKTEAAGTPPKRSRRISLLCHTHPTTASLPFPLSLPVFYILFALKSLKLKTHISLTSFKHQLSEEFTDH